MVLARGLSRSTMIAFLKPGFAQPWIWLPGWHGSLIIDFRKVYRRVGSEPDMHAQGS